MQKNLRKNPSFVEPICLFGGKVVQERLIEWHLNTETKTITKF